MKLLKPLLCHIIILMSAYTLYAQKTEAIPRTIELKKDGLDAKAVFISNSSNEILFDPHFQYGDKTKELPLL